MLHPHRRTVVRLVLVLGAMVALLAAIGGTIRALGAREEAAVDPSAVEGLSPSWTADLQQGPVTGLAFESGRLYVSTGQGLSVFDPACEDPQGSRCRPSWLGVVPDGPLSAPVVSAERVYAGSASGQVYAFPATCDAGGCSPQWVGIAGNGTVSRPGVNDDFVYVTSDRLYAFPAACGSADRPCPSTWSTSLERRATGDAPAVGGGVVVVSSGSVEGGVSAFPAVCTNRCEPLWTAETNGPATGVSIEGDTAYVVARGRLLAFPLSCRDTCRPSWTGTFAPGGGYAAGSAWPPAVGDGQVAIAGQDGTLWLFPASCDRSTCEPLRSVDLDPTGSSAPSIEGGIVYLMSADARLFAVPMVCDRGSPACARPPSTPVGSSNPAVPASGGGSVYAGDDAGIVHAYTLRTSGAP